MKGAGASFGFQAITDLGAALEQEAGRADTHASRTSVDELSTYLDRVEFAQSQGPGHGDDFAVRSPLSEPAAERAQRIVLIEDDDDMRTVFREVLEDRGHHVKEAWDGIEGLALILSEKPDVAIIDIGMRGMDGYEVARRVRTALGHSVRLVAITGHGKESDRVQALSAGFDTHLTKPVGIEQLERIFETSATQAGPGTS
jgi:CheY-like chemotaxis protein